jgi:hypothetical protein
LSLCIVDEVARGEECHHEDFALGARVGHWCCSFREERPLLANTRCRQQNGENKSCQEKQQQGHDHFCGLAVHRAAGSSKKKGNMAKNQANILIQFIGNSHLLYAMTIYNKTKYHGGDADAILLLQEE